MKRINQAVNIEMNPRTLADMPKIEIDLLEVISAYLPRFEYSSEH